MLVLEGVTGGYGPVQVLFGVDLAIGEGEVITLLGRNGMGKSTTIRTILGLNPATGGSIRFDGREISRLPSHRIARRGIGLVPEGRGIFPLLTVRENLIATSANRSGSASSWTLERVCELFPVLGERHEQMGGSLSGGEQQMLAIGRALMTNPRLLILDEATEGLAPLIREEIYRCIGLLKANGQSILIIDKHVEALAGVADRHVIMEKGRTVWSGDAEAFRSEPQLRARYLGV